MPIRTPAQSYARVIGWTLFLAGILGFFYNSSFDGSDRDAVLGVLDVNAWHNLVHLGSGLLGLMVHKRRMAARSYALGLGAVYAVVSVLGLAAGDGSEIAGLIPINTEDNILHLLLAAAGLGAGLATPGVPAPSTVPA